MTEQEIIGAAQRRGLEHPRIVYCFGIPELLGEGYGRAGWPLVWEIVEELGLSSGCGWHNGHQMDSRKVAP